MSWSCSAPFCKSRVKKGGGASASKNGFHVFPKQPERQQWIDAIKKITQNNLWEPKKHSCLCSKHFEKSCFIDESKKSNILKIDAVPTIFEKCLEENMTDTTATMKVCVICSKDSNICPRNTFYKFPASAELRTKWLDVLNMTNLEVTSNDHVCCNHFVSKIKNVPVRGQKFNSKTQYLCEICKAVSENLINLSKHIFSAHSMYNEYYYMHSDKFEGWLKELMDKTTLNYTSINIDTKSSVYLCDHKYGNTNINSVLELCPSMIYVDHAYNDFVYLFKRHNHPCDKFNFFVNNIQKHSLTNFCNSEKVNPFTYPEKLLKSLLSVVSKARIDRNNVSELIGHTLEMLNIIRNDENNTIIISIDGSVKFTQSQIKKEKNDIEPDIKKNKADIPVTQETVLFIDKETVVNNELILPDYNASLGVTPKISNTFSLANKVVEPIEKPVEAEVLEKTNEDNKTEEEKGKLESPKPKQPVLSQPTSFIATFDDFVKRMGYEDHIPNKTSKRHIQPRTNRRYGPYNTKMNTNQGNSNNLENIANVQQNRRNNSNINTDEANTNELDNTPIVNKMRIGSENISMQKEVNSPCSATVNPVKLKPINIEILKFNKVNNNSDNLTKTLEKNTIDISETDSDTISASESENEIDIKVENDIIEVGDTVILNEQPVPKYTTKHQRKVKQVDYQFLNTGKIKNKRTKGYMSKHLDRLRKNVTVFKRKKKIKPSVRPMVREYVDNSVSPNLSTVKMENYSVIEQDNDCNILVLGL